MHEYQSPLVTRTASKEMSHIWSDDHKFKLWRTLWYYLAKCEAELGLNITPEQLAELQAAIDKPIDYQKVAAYEAEINHDVMAHIRLLGDDAPAAAGIIHLGSTSQFVVDNADLMRIRDSLKIICTKLRKLIVKIGQLALDHSTVMCLGYTHFQPAQPTTMGRRMAQWAHDLYLVHVYLACYNTKALGVKGATGTQASFLELFGGSNEKVHALDMAVCREMGFDEIYMLTGQVYPRVDDSILICLLSNLAAVAQKVATDIRLLSGRGELYEAFGKKQVGSSAMPYKRNPLTCERVCGLSKFVIAMATAALTTTSEQWLERSLDDSSVRRLTHPEVFLAIDGILNSMDKIFSGIQINKQAIYNSIAEQLPFLITEKVLMIGCKHGVDRQKLHESIRQLATQYSGQEFLSQLATLPELKGIDLHKECAESYLPGRASEQVMHFHTEIIKPLAASPE